MTLKTGKRIEWKDIKYGDVYAILRHTGTFEIECKHSVEDECGIDSILLCCEEWGGDAGHMTSYPCSSQTLFKLPMSVQRLFKEV